MGNDAPFPRLLLALTLSFLLALLASSSCGRNREQRPWTSNAQQHAARHVTETPAVTGTSTIAPADPNDVVAGTCIGTWMSGGTSGSGTGTGTGTGTGSVATPPEQVVGLSPLHGATNAPTSQLLSWCTAGGADAYEVYLGVSSPPPLVITEITATEFDPGSLQRHATYYWRISSKNATGVTVGDVWWFRVIVQQPEQVQGLSPADGSIDVSTNTTLSWDVALRAENYDVYVGTTAGVLSLLCGDIPNNGCQVDLLHLTTYYWRIDSENVGGTTVGVEHTFQTVVEPPEPAVNPFPADLADNVSVTTVLSWDASARADGYHIYFGTSMEPPYDVTTVDPSLTPATPKYCTTYYWKIVPHNAGGNASVSETWRFRTEHYPLYIYNSVGVYMRFIPAGTFSMGNTVMGGMANESPLHTVNITQGFYIGVYELKQSQWLAVMGFNPSSAVGSNHPVEMVSWDDIHDFTAVLNALENTTAYRLPTEAEWEYVCRAGTTTYYYFGDPDDSHVDYAWFHGGETRPVGGKLPNAWGLHDMLGNVYEICEDMGDDDYYQYCMDNSIVDDPLCTNLPYPLPAVVFRGGCYTQKSSSSRRVVSFTDGTGNRNPRRGFRLCRELE